ncbi:MAG: FHA domain-containing protein [Desulfatiglans sp.]|nr:FHA domain-containing protein [Desulfatiglans sp.]
MHKLYVISGPMKGSSFDLKETTFFIGRSLKNDIQIKDSAVSRQQLKIFRLGKKLFLEDLKSTNGTSLNGEVINPGESYELTEGDTVSIAHTVVCVDREIPKQPLDRKSMEKPVEEEKKVKRKEASQMEPQVSIQKNRRTQSPKDLELVFKITELLRQSLEKDDMSRKVLEYLLNSLPRVDRTAIMLCDNSDGDIRRVFFRSRQLPEEIHFMYNQLIVERVLKGGKPVMMSNTGIKGEDKAKTKLGTIQIGSVMCVPLISDNKTLGAIYVDSIRGPNAFRKDDLLLLESLSGPIAVFMEKKMLASRLEDSNQEITIVK